MIVETMEVTINGGKVLINKSDFDPKIHNVKPKPKAAKKAAK